MDNVRARLIELIASKTCFKYSKDCILREKNGGCGSCFCGFFRLGALVDHLIENGVTVEEIATAAEQLSSAAVREVRALRMRHTPCGCNDMDGSASVSGSACAGGVMTPPCMGAEQVKNACEGDRRSPLQSEGSARDVGDAVPYREEDEM